MKRPVNLDIDHLAVWTKANGECAYNTVQVASMHALAELHGKLPERWGGAPYGPGVSSRKWDWAYGKGGSPEKFLGALEGGDKRAAASIHKLAKDMAKEVKLHGVLPEPEPCVAGGPVVVAAALAGTPLAFNRSVYREDSTSTLRIFIPIGAKAAISTSDLRKAMVAQLALAVSLSAARPVQLEAYAGEHVYSGAIGHRQVLIRIPIGMTPIDWGMVAALSQPGMFRDLIFKLCSWGSLHNKGSELDNLRCDIPSRRDLGAEPGDLLLTRGDIDNAAYNGVEWVKEQIAKVNQAADEQPQP